MPVYYEKLNFKWDEIHEVAEELEHVSSDQLIDNLDKYLKYPKIDPHGDPIPNKLGEIDFVDKISISDLNIGQKGIVSRIINEDEEFFNLLNKLKIEIGTEVKLIDKIEYDSIISKLETSPIDYLKNKYQLIKEFYDLDKTVSMNDFMAIEEFIEENEFFNLYDELSELAKQEYLGTILPSYYKGRFIEETGDPKKAMYIYRSAYNMKEVKGLTKEYLLELAERIKEDFNY